MVQWLGLSAFTATTLAQSLVGEVRSHKLLSSPRKKKRKEKKTQKPTDNCSWLELQLSREDMGGALGSRQIVFHSCNVGIPRVEEATKVF